MRIQDLIGDEAARQAAFPVTSERIFLAHAGVAPLPSRAVAMMEEFLRRGSVEAQETRWAETCMDRTRETAARLIGAKAEEIALLGPTSLGLSLVANGLPWEEGDEVVYYSEDYPANVYPWLGLRERGVKPVALQPPGAGQVTWELIERALTPRTKLVALASCHFLSGYRIDVEGIGRKLHDRGVLFCVDGIQTLGAFPMSVEYVDFLSADSHKWMLGPAGAGIFYVKAERQAMLRPTLLGSWNVVSPNFIAQNEIDFYPGGRRYEPGMLNLPGNVGMLAAMELLLEIGVENVAERLLTLREHFLDRVRASGWRLYIEEVDQDPNTPDAARSAIMSLTHPEKDLKRVNGRLRQEGIVASLRHNRAGEAFLRFSPHFYNTFEELDLTAEVLAE